MNHLLRLNKVRSLLMQLACDAIMIDDPINIFYLSGLELSAGKIIITQDMNYLIVDGRYYEQCLNQMLFTPILLADFKWENFFKKEPIQSLGFDSQKTTYANFKSLTEVLQEWKINLLPFEEPLENLRIIKDPDEIACLKTAAHLNVQGYNFIKTLISHGISEEKLALELEIFWKRKGAKKLSFDSIIAFGVNSSMPHYRANKTLLENQTHILIDIGVEWNHYHSDMTRIRNWKNLDPKIEKIFSIVQEAKEQAMKICRPGTRVGELDQIARDYISSKGYGKNFTHSLGHGVGLEVHEAPQIRANGRDKDKELEAGMVITIEPGIYLPGIGGVRLEDTLLITENGYENLTAT